MATRLGQLLTARAQGKAALSEARRELRVARQQEARFARAQARHWELSPLHKAVVLIAYGLAAYEAEASVMYLGALGRQNGWPSRADEELARVVEGEFLVVDELYFVFLDLGDPANPWALRDAIALVEEWRVAVWARRFFLKTGAAVPTACILRRFNANRLLLPEEWRPPFRGTVDELWARKWVARWRTRWGGFYGKAPVREPSMSVEDAYAKATDETRGLSHAPMRPLISRAVRLVHCCWFRCAHMVATYLAGSM